MMESASKEEEENMGRCEDLPETPGSDTIESSMDIEQSVPTVAELRGKSDNEDVVGPTRRKRATYTMLVLPVLVVVIVVAVVVAVTVQKGNGQSSGDDDPNSLKNMDHQESFSEVVKYLGNHDISQFAELIREGSPTNKAAKWMAHEDPRRKQIPKDSPASKDGYSFMQRYIMTLIYFQMGGENWKYDLNFLTGADTCDWYSWIMRSGNSYPMGAFCNKNELIAALVFVGADVKGPLPTEIAKLTTLRIIEMDVNEISGPIPSEFHSLVNLQNLHLSHNKLTGPLPSYLGSLPELETIDVSFNTLDGALPSELASMPALRGIAVDNNLFSGDLSFWGKAKATTGSKQDKLKYLFLEKNLFDGMVEETMVDMLPNLIVLDVSDNNLRGPIPTSLFRLNQLSVLDLHDNSFTGSIPQDIPANTALKFLALQRNELTGRISETIGNLQMLTHLDVSNNKLTGYESNSMTGFGLAALKQLSYLFLSANAFEEEPFPLWLQTMTNLEEFSLKSLQIVGTFPEWVGDLSNLVLLDVDNNQLAGSIPTQLGKLKKLQFLLLNRNKLKGEVPVEIGNLSSLRLFYLDGNDLGGNLDMICKRPETSRAPIMVADCAKPDPDIECDCCVKCCASDEPCNDDNIVPSNDPIWQFGYDRLFYTFGNYTGYFYANP